MPDDSKLGTDITIENIMTPDAFLALGSLAAQALRELGEVTLVVRPDGAVTYANPAKVHIERDAIPDAELLARPFRYVRPIMSDRRPRFVAWKDQSLWEIEFEEVDQALEINQGDQHESEK